MDVVTIAMIILGITTNLICFLFGMIAGRNSAYKTVRTYETFETADTMHDVPGINTFPGETY